MATHMYSVILYPGSRTCMYVSLSTVVLNNRDRQGNVMSSIKMHLDK